MPVSLSCGTKTLRGYDIHDTFTKKLTARQRHGLAILIKHTNTLLYGGARSGKTFLLVCAVILRAIRYPGSRHLIARLRYSHVRASIWLDTLPAAVKFLGLEKVCQWREADHYLEISIAGAGKSQIWVDGLDDRERIDKILGREYLTIYLNEVSQISYSTVTTVLTRLAQNLPGATPKLFADENPPSKFHWSNKMYLQHIDPETGDPVEGLGVLQMNPEHNAENLPEGYIENILKKLPPHKRLRFLDGEFGDTEGVIFRDWDVIDAIPESVKNNRDPRYGLDFGFSVDPAALVELYLVGDDLYVHELIYQTGLTNQMLVAECQRLGVTTDITADSAEPKSIEELRIAGLDIGGAAKGPDSVRQGIDWLLSKKIHVTRASVSIQAELENYCWKENKEGKPLPAPVDDWNHIIDAIRYGMEDEIRAYVPMPL